MGNDLPLTFKVPSKSASGMPVSDMAMNQFAVFCGDDLKPPQYRAPRACCTHLAGRAPDTPGCCFRGRRACPPVATSASAPFIPNWDRGYRGVTHVTLSAG